MASHSTSSESDLRETRDSEGFEIGSSMPAPPSGNQGPGQQPKEKTYHRHTQYQTQEMESVFMRHSHLDQRQRRILGRELGLEPDQVKYWFQNRRRLTKFQSKKHEIAILEAENKKLRAENDRYKEAFINVACPNCGGPISLGETSLDEQHLRIESAQPREQVEEISRIAAQHGKMPMASCSNLLSHSTSHIFSHLLDVGVSNFGAQSSGTVGELHGSLPFPTDADKPMIVKLAVAALEELTKLVLAGPPLWVPTNHLSESLNEEEYLKTFPRGIDPKTLGLRREASRESAMVMMDPILLVQTLMDVDQWSAIFCGIISRASTLQILLSGVEGNDLQVMSAEFQVSSPFVPTRENYFARYCKQHLDGTWVIVDVSLDDLRPSTISRSRRRPSGCVIQELQNGYSKVTWIEHVEVDDRVVPTMYRPLVNSGLAFGAKRWVAILERQCERIASSKISNMPARLCTLTRPEERKNVLKLAKRMMKSYCTSVGASTANAGTTPSTTEYDGVRFATTKSIDDPSKPSGLVLNAATSLWLPAPPRKVFDFLRDQSSRSVWDTLSSGGLIQEISYIANGRDLSNCVSLLRINSANFNQNSILILQESCTDSTGSYVVYAPVDTAAMNTVLGGGNPDHVALLPSGFAILPDGPGMNEGPILDVGSGGSLLTVMFQILADSDPTAKLSMDSMATVNRLVKYTIEKIKTTVMSDST